MSYPQRKHLVEHLFPYSSVNLFAGPSGAGKTRLLFQLILQLLKGEPILGFKCLEEIRPLYICYDRLIASVYETLNDMKIFFGDQMKIISLAGKLHPTLPTLDEIKDYNLVMTDGIDALVGQGKIIDFAAVTQIIRGCQLLAEQSQAAIIGVLGTTKLKMDGNGYAHSREKLIGSSSWARMSDNIILVQPDPNDTTKKYRTIDICLRNGGSDKSLAYEFSPDGWLKPVKDIVIEAKLHLSKNSYSLINIWPLDSKLTTDQVETLATHLSPPVSRATLFRMINELQDHRLIVKSSHGEYSLNQSKPN